MCNKNLKLTLILLCFSFSSIIAQPSLVKGIITTSKEPVRNARIVFINDEDTAKQYVALSDSVGNYKLVVTTGIDETEINIPAEFELDQNYPNPFYSETVISYRLNKPFNVYIKIYDILGREIKTFSIGQLDTGNHIVRWDGKNNSGQRVTPGIYIYLLDTGTSSKGMKMILNGSEPSAIIPLVTKKSLHVPELTNKKNNFNELNNYLVRIENTSTTTPKIRTSIFKNIVIEKDTTINFEIPEAELWKSLGLEKETVTAIAIDPVNAHIIYAGTLYDYSTGTNGKLLKSINGGITWDTLLIGGGYRNIIIDPSNNNTVYALPGGIIKSTDGGRTWKTIVEGIHLDFETRLMCIAMNPKNSKILFAGTGGLWGGNLYMSRDGGLRWNKVQPDSLTDGIISIEVDPVDTNKVYIGTADRGILWKSTDAGMTWFRTGLGETGQLINNILVDTNTLLPTIYAGLSWKGIYKTEDGGMHWKSINQGLPRDCSVMKIQKSSKSRLFIIGSSINGSGVYEYVFQGDEWIKIGINFLENQYYYYSELKITSGLSRLYFGGKGIYVMDLKE